MSNISAEIETILPPVGTSSVFESTCCTLSMLERAEEEWRPWQGGCAAEDHVGRV